MTQLINPKSKVPALTVPTVGGGSFSIFEATPENFQIIVAYRGKHCPKCKAQLQDIDPMVDDLKSRGFDVVAISMDSEERANDTVKEWDLKNLTVGYDLSLLTAKAYGLFISDAISDKEPKLFSEPGVFVVKPDGTLYAEFVQNTPFSRPDMKELASGLEYAVKNDYPVRGTSLG